MRLAFYFLKSREEGQEMVTIYPEFPGTVFISVSILTSITQCVFISYVENTKHHHS